MNLHFEQIADYNLSPQDIQDLQLLLQKCFPGYFLDRLYHKQVPKFRILAKNNGQIIGQLGIEYRIVYSKEYGALQVFGAIDLCVTEEFRNQSVATELLRHIEQISENIDAIILFADNHQLYSRLGYVSADVMCRFLAIEEHESIKVMERDMGDCFMIKSLKGLHDMNGDYIDMLGYVF